MQIASTLRCYTQSPAFNQHVASRWNDNAA